MPPLLEAKLALEKKPWLPVPVPPTIELIAVTLPCVEKAKA